MDRTGLSGPHGLATDSCWMKSMTDLRCEAVQVKSAVRAFRTSSFGLHAEKAKLAPCCRIHAHGA